MLCESRKGRKNEEKRDKEEKIFGKTPKGNKNQGKECKKGEDVRLSVKKRREGSRKTWRTKGHSENLEVREGQATKAEGKGISLWRVRVSDLKGGCKEGRYKKAGDR